MVQEVTNDFGKPAQTTGGDLKPTKYIYYFLTYHTVPGKTKLKPLSNFANALGFVELKQKDRRIKIKQSHISVPPSDGKMVPTPTKDVSESAGMLGTFFTPIKGG